MDKNIIYIAIAAVVVWYFWNKNKTAAAPAAATDYPRFDEMPTKPPIAEKTIYRTVLVPTTVRSIYKPAATVQSDFSRLMQSKTCLR